MAQQRDPLGSFVARAYDANGNALVVQAGGTSPPGGILAETVVTYDALNRPTQTAQRFLDGSTPDVVTATSYTAVDQPKTVTDALGRVAIFGYDAADRLVQTTDPAGNLTELVLDRGGNPVTTTLREQSAQGLQSVSATAVFDALGRPVQQRDPLQNLTHRVYDARGLVVSTTDPEGNTTSSEYDGLNCPVHAVQAPSGPGLRPKSPRFF